jgi:glycosyltransferase involved in cell wall biosynthesis
MTNIKSPIKIAIVAVLYPPNHSGTGLRAHRTYKRLKNKYGVKPIVIARNKTKLTDCIDEYDGMDIIRVKSSKSLIALILIMGKVFYKYDINKYDVVHCFGSGYLNIATAIWAKLFSRKLIMELTMNQVKVGAKVYQKIQALLYFIRVKLLLQILQRKADLVIAMNHSIYKYYLDIGISHNNIWVRPNPVDETSFTIPTSSDQERARNLLRINKEKFVHLLLGGICPRKNQLFALECIRILPRNHLLLLAGPIDSKYPDYYANINQIINENNLNERVLVYEGFQNDIKSLYHAADILMIPSTNEGTPNVMLEGLCCGLPVFINKDLNLKEYIRNGFNGWNLPLRVESFAQAIMMWERNYSSREKKKEISYEAHRNYGAKKIDHELFKRLIQLRNL